MINVSRLFTLVVLSCACYHIQAQTLAERQVLTSEGVEVLATAAHAEAITNGWDVVIAVVDAGGHLVYLRRMDNVQLASLEIAQRKARTAALYRRPTQVFADRLASGNESVRQLPNVISLPGGLPIIVNGDVIGAVGVSGVQGNQDAQIAQAGIAALIAHIGE